MRYHWMIGLFAGWWIVFAGNPDVVHAVPELVQQKKCNTCHRFDAETPQTGLIGPDLFYAGQKFKADWLRRFLRNPKVIRLAGHTTDPGFARGKPQFQPPHPSVSAEEADSLTQYLMSLKLKDLETANVDTTPLSKVERVKAKMLFERDYSCIACHQSYNLTGQPRGGISGPSLLDAGDRLQASWVYLWLKNPRQFTDKGRMPRYQLDEETLQLLTRYVVSHTRKPDQ